MARRRHGNADDGAIEHRIEWHCALLDSSEQCSFVEHDNGYRFHGVVVISGDRPCEIDYSLEVDREWRTRDVAATIVTSSERRAIAVRARDVDRWEVNGDERSDLDGCDDLDLGWSPVTNTMPIRRLDSEIGEPRYITAVWISFPELNVVRNVQTYTRLASDRWRYQSGAYDFELDVDPETGLVLKYGDELWRASALEL